MRRCSACGRFATQTGGAKCSKCFSLYHRKCINMSNDVELSPDWKCSDSNLKKPCTSPKNYSTPSGVAKEKKRRRKRSARAGNFKSSNSSGDIDAHFDGCRSNNRIDIGHELKHIQQHLKTIANEMAAFRQHVNTHITQIDSSVSDFEKRVANLQQRLSDTQATSAGHKAEYVLAELTCQRRHCEESSYRNEIIIIGISEVKGENLVRIVTSLSKNIGVELNECDVGQAKRVGRQREDAPGAEGSKPRPIVVTFVRRTVRDSLIREARLRGLLLT